MKREDKLRYSGELKDSPAWKWMRDELKDKVTLNKFNISSEIKSAEEMAFRNGVVAGIEFCIEFPEKAYKDNTRFFDNMMKKVMDGE